MISYEYRYSLANKILDKFPKLVLETSNYDLCIVFRPQDLKFQNEGELQLEIQKQTRERDLTHCIIQYHITETLEKNQQMGIDKAQELTTKFFYKADKDGDRELDFKEFQKEFQKLHTADNSGTIQQDELKKIFRDILYKDQILEIYLMYSNLGQEVYQKRKEQLQNGKIMHQSQVDLDSLMQKSIRQKGQSGKNGTLDSELMKSSRKKMNKITMDNHIIKDYYKLMTIKEFMEFLRCEQGDVFEVSEAKLQELFRTVYTDNFYYQLQNEVNEKTGKQLIEILREQDGDIYDNSLNISLYQFHNYLMSSQNSIFHTGKTQVFQDMEKPLTDYFINSSHNTYLLENQLTGQSSVNAYRNAFFKGCKCVELDIWIKENAFDYSEFPLILSFENHCTKPYQKQMAQLLNQHLKNQIYYVPNDALVTDKYPSPKDLKNKIIIKGKAKLEEALKGLYKDDYVQETKYHVNSEDLQFQDEENLDNLVHLEEKTFKEVPKIRKLHNLIPRTKAQDLSKFQSEGDVDEDDRDDELDKEVELGEELTPYIAMFGTKFGISGERNIWQISSLSESKLLKISKKYQKELIDWHSRYLSRVYPFGLRFNSSNYDPFPSLLSGSQIVALNVQTYDIHQLIYMGMFQQNGGRNSGYVLKPKWMRHGEILKHQNDFNDIQVILGQFLRPFDYENNVSDIVDPFVEIQIKGSELDTQKNKKQITNIIFDNGFNPVWTPKINSTNKKTLEFNLRCPDLAQVVIQVYDKDIIGKEKLGWYSLPFNCIRPGFRVVQLLDQKLNTIENSCLFLHIDITHVKPASIDNDLQQYPQNNRQYYVEKFKNIPVVTKFNGKTPDVFNNKEIQNEFNSKNQQNQIEYYTEKDDDEDDEEQQQFKLNQIVSGDDQAEQVITKENDEDKKILNNQLQQEYDQKNQDKQNQSITNKKK
ncbi:PLC-like phosphodiesterase, TIM beta/alpha-barrel domain [Pseudocohnilembus persalinus]|uniref:Phosphoinositide phospholipase C n=1 Tax=Pseudocohnilembus persalinus TaxID=266149 RepID=A0A0V0QGH2_PSEPJ|nr:PLC-like phosphodiesterase, TIM beta/alpha-barrel domain [Pseudocohnilembus persalinus]|eukprot:KRX01226.1 PLC-like phosphodiesterase, TIM beta/alpha-barrel domain [Pseudocohnilembus persalinus]